MRIENEPMLGKLLPFIKKPSVANAKYINTCCPSLWSISLFIIFFSNKQPSFRLSYASPLFTKPTRMSTIMLTGTLFFLVLTTNNYHPSANANSILPKHLSCRFVSHVEVVACVPSSSQSYSF